MPHLERYSCSSPQAMRHRSEVETEYQSVLETAQEIQEYWEQTNRERLARIASLPPKPGQEEIHAKLRAWKAKLGLTR